jgi:hypothetical protein
LRPEPKRHAVDQRKSEVKVEITFLIWIFGEYE